MTIRLLEGAERIAPGKWQWGCWEISREPISGYWMAFDTQTALGPDPGWALLNERLLLGGFAISSLHWFLWELNERGNAPLTAGQVDALRVALEVQS